jgi:hypothetical protein
MSLNPAQQESISSLLRILGAAGLAGAGARAGFGVLRNANRAYDPPEIPKPLIVDMPYASREAPPLTSIPLPKQQTKEKVANGPTVEGTIKAIPGGEWLLNKLPPYTPLEGRPDAAGPGEVPAHGLAAMPTAAIGLGGGYMLADKLLRAADRRGARGDIDDAQEEYRRAVMERLTKQQPGKVAADLVKMAADQTPEDADLRRAKIALDRLFTQKKAEGDLGENALKSWLYPGRAIGPQAAWANMALAGGLGTLGGYAGWRASREKDEAVKVRERIKALDKLNAKKIPAPVIARLVPVQPDQI